MDSNCLCLLCPSGPNSVRFRAILPTKPKPVQSEPRMSGSKAR